MNTSSFILNATALEWAWGLELQDITPEELVILVYDFFDAATSEDISTSEYKRRIGEGNLRSYVDCLKAGNYNAGRHVPGTPYVTVQTAGDVKPRTIPHVDIDPELS